MVLRRNSTRRRRLVIDPNVQLGEEAVASVDSKVDALRGNVSEAIDARTYSYGADRRSQHKTTDMIPKRVLSYLIVVMMLLAGLWLVNFTSQNASQWVGRIGQAGVGAFAIQGQGSLANWFSSFLLIMTGLASLQIYALRQHRCDDYRGTYRLWLWTAALLILASIHCVTDLGTVATNLFHSISKTSFAERAWIPFAIKLGALSVLLGRGLFEVRESRGSFALVVFVWVAYSAAAVLQLPAVNENMVGLQTESMIGNCVLFATAGLFLAHLTYARFIFLHAHGLIIPRAKKEKRVKVKKAKPARAKKAKKRRVATDSTDTESKTTRKKTRKKVATKSTPATADEKQVAPPAKTKTARKKKASKPAPIEAVNPPDTSSAPPAKTPSDVLKELAAASRAKAQSTSQPETIAFEPADEHEGVIKLSKAQRRKQRKTQKQNRRAA